MIMDDQRIGNDGANQDQDEASAKTVRHVMKLFRKAKRYREKYDKNWLHYYKMFRGDQWDGVKMPSHRQKEVINLIWQTIQSSLPLQTDVRPKITFIPEDPTDQEFAEVLNHMSEHDWDTYDWLARVTEVILDGYIYGQGFSSLHYDPTVDGVGAAVYKSEDPFYLYPDPDAEQINDDMGEFFIKAEPVSTEKLRKSFPEFGDEIKSDVRDVLKSSKTSLNDYKVRTVPTDRDMPDVSFFGGDEDTDSDKTLMITAYLKPQDTEDELEDTGDISEDGKPQTKVVEKKLYPRGRRVVIANGILLWEGELPYAHGKFPFSKYLNYILPREFYGVSEVEQLESPQRTFNKLVNASLEILNLMGNPIWVVSTDSGIDPENLVNRTGLVVEKEPGSEARREMGAQISPSALQMIDRMEQWFNNLAGTQDVSRGQTPGSVTAASAIEQLQDAARTRIKQKQRNLDSYIRDVGKQYAPLILEKYSAPRVVRITNDKGDAEYFKIHMDPGKTPESYLASITHYRPNEAGTLVEVNQIKELLVKGKFDVKVNTGSSLPFAVADKENKILALFDRGIVDEKEVLDALEYPNRDEVLQRLEQRKALLAEQEQLQGG